VLRDIQVPMCDLHVLEDLPFTAEKYYDITLDEDPDFDWEALCEAHDLLRLVLPEQPHVPPAFLFFADELRPMVAFRTTDQQAWLVIDPVGDEEWTTDWSELVPFILVNAGIAVLLAWFVSGSLARRVQRLSRLSQQFAEGNLEARAAVQGKDAVAILGNNFNRMADSLQRVIEDQRDLLRAVAHELRTPLARIGIAVGIAEIDNPQIEKQMISIQDDLQELEDLIAEITEYLRLEHGHTLVQETIDLKAVSQEIVRQELRDINHVQVSIEADDAIHFVGHRNSIKRCLGNVIRNAGRYAQQTIKISLSVSDADLRLLVEDDGPGFPAAMLDELTTAFVSTSDGRLGLGLALCRRIVELSGGRLALQERSSVGGAGVEIIVPQGLGGG
jgi:signal transduction histidine kinase